MLHACQDFLHLQALHLQNDRDIPCYPHDKQAWQEEKGISFG